MQKTNIEIHGIYDVVTDLQLHLPIKATGHLVFRTAHRQLQIDLDLLVAKYGTIDNSRLKQIIRIPLGDFFEGGIHVSCSDHACCNPELFVKGADSISYTVLGHNKRDPAAMHDHYPLTRKIHFPIGMSSQKDGWTELVHFRIITYIMVPETTESLDVRPNDKDPVKTIPHADLHAMASKWAPGWLLLDIASLTTYLSGPAYLVRLNMQENHVPRLFTFEPLYAVYKLKYLGCGVLINGQMEYPIYN